MLGGSVGNDIQTALESNQTRDVDDLSIAVFVELSRDVLTGDSASRLQHVSAGITGDSEDSVHVDLDDLLPVVIGEVFDRVSTLDTTWD